MSLITKLNYLLLEMGQHTWCRDKDYGLDDLTFKSQQVQSTLTPSQKKSPDWLSGPTRRNVAQV